MKKVFSKKYSALVRQINKYMPENGQLTLLKKAFWFGFDAHKDQVRRSGDPYFIHCVEAANILIDLKMDVTTIAAGLLHDVVEDTGVTIDEVKQEFGDDIAMLVDGVTKIADLRYKESEVIQAENFRKILLSMARDIRVIMIKFSDRLHNMRTLEYLPAKKQIWIARETLDVYAPLAHRFGIARLGWQLEDLALKFLDVDAYNFLNTKIKEIWPEQMRYIEAMKRPIRKEMVKLNVPCSIVGRPKSFYSIYKKMKNRDIPLEDIYDLLAMRIITESVKDCYAAVGVIHTHFTPVADRFKDYIATPKSNGYQSIHTTVINPEGRMLEVQIRTKSMDYIAEMGIAAHWSYKTESDKSDLDEQLGWVRQFIDWNIEDADPAEFMQSFKFDLFQNEIFVFTPRGKLIQLPINATPIDFAFAVHSEVGMHCIGAKVNSKVVQMNMILQNGDEVEILTSTKPNPQEYWMAFAVTARAQSQIKKWFRDNKKLQYEQLGREMLEKEFLHYGLALNDLDTDLIRQRSGFKNLEMLYQALAKQEITPVEIVKRVNPDVIPKSKSSLLTRLPRIWKKESKETPSIVINGAYPLVVELSRCCMPVPGDTIVGFYNENNEVVVHRSRCSKLPQTGANGKTGIKVEWAPELGDKVFPAKITVSGIDRMHLLRDIAVEISTLDINLLAIHIEIKDSVASCSITLEVKNTRQLQTVNQRISKIKGIQRVKR
ncbi:RelA/SpoT family protein [candidate division KSB1 bacterium]